MISNLRHILLVVADKEGTDPQARSGSLVIEGESCPAKRQDLPTIAETFKTYDDCNLVKSGDIGQVIVCREWDNFASIISWMR